MTIADFWWATKGFIDSRTSDGDAGEAPSVEEYRAALFANMQSVRVH